MNELWRDAYHRSMILGSVFGLVMQATAGEPGKMTRELWTNVSGGRISDFTGSPRYWQAADSLSMFAGSVAPSNAGNAFASRARGYITAPLTGDYTFWIASDDASELRLSSDDSKFNRVKVASVSGWVGPQAWDVQSSQRSAVIRLEAGRRYFLEALHVDAGGADHLAIAWQAPGGQRELIPETALESFTVDPNDADNDDLEDAWEIAIGFSITDNGVLNPAQHPLADPDGDGYSNWEESSYGTNPNQRGGIPGCLSLETWNGIAGARVDDLRWNPRFIGTPNLSEFVFSAETPLNRADNYGARLRGYVIAPASGDYTFYVAGDDSCELWLSPSDGQFAKQRISFVNGYTGSKQWTKYASQKSVAIPLVAGAKYYVEALVKEGGGGDHLSIGWLKPGTTAIEVIPGSALESHALDADDKDGDEMPDTWEIAHGLDPEANDASADPDFDGIPNYLESSLEADPQVRDTIPGGLVLEQWLGIPGYNVKALTDSPRFLLEPDSRTLVTSAQTNSQPYDGFGNRMRGYLTAPATGDYTFWVMGDDETEFWLSSSASKFDKELLVRPTLNATNFDTDLSQRSRSVRLVAGQSYYLEVLHKEYYGGDFCQVAWTKPGAAREIIPGSVLSTFAPTSDDRDDDDLPDSWELANGLDSHDNGRSISANGSQGDLDGDDLLNADEWKAGTRADLADTDGDGVSDHDEIVLLETAALTADVAPFEQIASFDGCAFSASHGTWYAEGAGGFQGSTRGWVEYDFNLAGQGVYQTDIRIVPRVVGPSLDPLEVVVEVDGLRLGRQEVQIRESETATVKLLSPWLAAGSHKLRVHIDNAVTSRRVGIQSVGFAAARGVDANANGVPDWVDARVAKYNSFDAPSESITSPVCLEGKARWPGATTLNGTVVQTAPDDRWYANVALESGQATPISASLENGAIAITREISWIPVNLLESGDLTIRQGDSLKLTAFVGEDAATTGGAVLTIGGESHVVGPETPWIYRFDSPGSIPVTIATEGDENAPETTVTIQVVAALEIESPICVAGHDREVDIPALPTGVVLQMDRRIKIRGTTTYSAGSVRHILRLDGLEDRLGLLRLGGNNGPVLGSLPFRSMRVRSGAETSLTITDDSQPNLIRVAMPVVIDGLWPDAEVKLDIFIGGVTFGDGSLLRTIAPASECDASGTVVADFLKAGSAGSTCHRVAVWQGGRRIAWKQ